MSAPVLGRLTSKAVLETTLEEVSGAVLEVVLEAKASDVLLTNLKVQPI